MSFTWLQYYQRHNINVRILKNFQTFIHLDRCTSPFDVSTVLNSFWNRRLECFLKLFWHVVEYWDISTAVLSPDRTDSTMFHRQSRFLKPDLHLLLPCVLTNRCKLALGAPFVHGWGSSIPILLKFSSFAALQKGFFWLFLLEDGSSSDTILMLSLRSDLTSADTLSTVSSVRWVTGRPGRSSSLTSSMPSLNRLCHSNTVVLMKQKSP